MNILTNSQIRSNERQTWQSLILGTLIWFLHLNIVYAIASVSCKWGWFSSKTMGISELQLIEAIITLVTMLLLLVTIYLPWRDWQRFQTEKPKDNPQMLEDTEKDRRPLVAFITMLMNSLFFLFVIAFFVPIFAL